MYKEITELLFQSPGILKEDAIERYQREFPRIQYPEHKLNMAINELATNLVGKESIREEVPKSIHTGMSQDSLVFKYTENNKVYYLKIAQQFPHHLGIVLGYFYFSEQKFNFFQTASVIKHGTLYVKNDVQYFYTLAKEAPGESLTIALKGKNNRKILDYVKSVARSIASLHNEKSQIASPLRQSQIAHLSCVKNYNRLFDSTKKNKDSFFKPTIYKKAKILLPSLLISQAKYLKGKQYESISGATILVQNSSYCFEKQKLTTFDTTAMFPFFGPNTPPTWGSEFLFASFIQHIIQSGLFFDLDQLFVDRCLDTFLNTYHSLVETQIMTREGIDLFFTIATLSSLNDILDFGDEKYNLYINQFTKYKNSEQKYLDLFLNI